MGTLAMVIEARRVERQMAAIVDLMRAGGEDNAALDASYSGLRARHDGLMDRLEGAGAELN